MDPQDARLFANSTARPIGADGFYVAGLQLFLGQVGVGITDAISVQAGALLLPGEYFGQILVAMPKVTFLNRRTSFLLDDTPLALAFDAEIIAQRATRSEIQGYGTGSFYVTGRRRVWDVFATPRLLATYGTTEAALTMGVGVPLGGDRAGHVVTAMLGGEVQVREGLKLLTENHAYFGLEQSYSALTYEDGRLRRRAYSERGTLVVLGGGLRFFWDHFAIEAAAQVSTSTFPYEGTDIWPVLSISYRM